MYNGIAFHLLKLYHIKRENVLVTMEESCGTVALWHCGTVALWHCGTAALRHGMMRVQGLNLGRGGLDGSERQGFMLRQNAV